jgi:CO dehydrogenase/acetyl-CoA synthase beta subunit
MRLFEKEISDARDLLERMPQTCGLRTWRAETIAPWPEGSGNRHIPASDTSVELGPPDLSSILMTLITDNPGSVHDGLITLLGPDIAELGGGRAPLVKILFIESSGVTDEDLYDFYVDVNLARLDVSLSGYMTRASSGMRREWCRISRDAAIGGISLSHIGACEIASIKRVSRVSGVEMAIITDSTKDISAFSEIAFRVERIASALCKLSKDILHDCERCGFSDLCSSLEALRRIREARREGGG